LEKRVEPEESGRPMQMKMTTKELQQAVEEVVRVLDEQRRTGVCDEYAILASWADQLIWGETVRGGIAKPKRQHVTADAQAAIYEKALLEIANNSGLTRNKMIQVAQAATRRARAAADRLN
jgi:hypothetical protein